MEPLSRECPAFSPGQPLLCASVSLCANRNTDGAPAGRVAGTNGDRHTEPRRAAPRWAGTWVPHPLASVALTPRTCLRQTEVLHDWPQLEALQEQLREEVGRWAEGTSRAESVVWLQTDAAGPGHLGARLGVTGNKAFSRATARAEGEATAPDEGRPVASASASAPARVCSARPARAGSRQESLRRGALLSRGVASSGTGAPHTRGRTLPRSSGPAPRVLEPTSSESCGPTDPKGRASDSRSV